MDLRRICESAAKAQHMRVIGRGRKKTAWPLAEDETIKELYPNTRRILRKLPHRTRSQIKYRARCLGVLKQNRSWLASEVARLRRLYPTRTKAEVLAAFPGWKWERIKTKVITLRLRKTRRRLKAANMPLLDEIRECAFLRNLSMVDVDALAGTRRYFQNKDYNGILKPNLERLLLAIAALDGEISVRFQDSNSESRFYRLKIRRRHPAFCAEPEIELPPP